MKKILPLLFTLICLKQVIAQNCNNIGFENGTKSSWSFEEGMSVYHEITPCICYSGLPQGIYYFNYLRDTIVSATSTIGSQCTNGVDNYGGFPVVAPNGGNYSLLLNNNLAGSKTENASHSYVITPGNSSITFHFAAVLQDVGHTDSAKPYFIIDVQDAYGSSILDLYDTCAMLTGWQRSTVDTTVNFLPWTDVTIDLSSMMNQTVYINFWVNDCTDSLHFGYAYVDGGCNTYHVNSSNALCTLGDSTILSGPTGLASYNWSGPKNGTSQNLSTAIPGNYTLTTTSFFPGLVLNPLYYHVSVDSVVSTFTVNSACSNDSTYFVQQSIGNPNSWLWNFGDGSPSVSIQNPTHAYTTGGTYTATLITANSCGAIDTVSDTVTVKPSPNLSVSGASFQTVCSGDSVHPIIFNVTPAGTVNWVNNNTAIGLASSNSGNIAGFSASTVGIQTIGIITANAIATATGCLSANSTYTITIDPLPTVSYILQKDTTQVSTWDAYPNYSTSVTSATWYWGDGSSTSGLYPSHTYSVAGKYNICVSAFSSNGCSASACQNDSIYRLAYNSTNSSMVQVNVLHNTTGINELKIIRNELKVYPNPSNGSFTISSNSNIDELKITDILGQTIYEAKSNTTNTTLQIDKPGIYFITVTTGKETTTKKVIINK